MLPWLPGFPPQAFPTTISSLTSPQSLSPQLTAACALGCSTVPKLQLQPFRGSMSLSGTYGCSKDCLILIPFRLPQISYFIPSLKCFSSDSDNCPHVGIRPLVQFSHLLRAGPVLLTLLFPPLVPSSFEFCMGLYIIFSGQVLLSILS